MHPEDVWTRAARFVLVLLILLIAITPVTQSIWSGDNFLQGHDDTEYTLLLVLTFVSLFLLLCRSKQGDIRELLCRLKGWLVFILRALWDEGRPLDLGVLNTTSTCSRVRPCEAGYFNLPLLI
jgi:membrane protease YdiL (CAAX protease family)